MPDGLWEGLVDAVAASGGEAAVGTLPATDDGTQKRPEAGAAAQEADEHAQDGVRVQNDERDAADESADGHIMAPS